MAIIEGVVGGLIVGVADEVGVPLHVVAKPDYTDLGVAGRGHYRTSHRCAMVATQAANSRLFEFRNGSSQAYVVHRIGMRWIQTANHTASIEDSLDVFKVTGFSGLDSVNTVTLTASKMALNHGASAATIRGVTVAGAAAGMTGGTLTKDTDPIMRMPKWLLQTMSLTIFPPMDAMDFEPQVASGEHPLVLSSSEGFIIENRALLGAAAGSGVYIDVAWTEMDAY